jgi:hypothetical protein
MFQPWWCLEEFEDTKGVIRIRKSKKDIHHNAQKKKDKRAKNAQLRAFKATEEIV